MSGVLSTLRWRYDSLAELAGAYDVLVLDIHHGRRRVPRWRALKSYRGRR
ncbi:hypothetical protein [Salinispora arenicola]|nr:hypothetical protein [Salinispora arenicola]